MFHGEFFYFYFRAFYISFETTLYILFIFVNSSRTPGRWTSQKWNFSNHLHTAWKPKVYVGTQQYIYIYIYIYIKFYTDVALILSQTKERLILQITQQTFASFQDILKTSTLSTRLQHNNFSSLKTSWRHLSRHLTSLWRPKIVMLRTSSRCLENMSWILLLDLLETNKVFTGDYCLQII